MLYRVVTYDRASERMRGSMIVPPVVLVKVQKIAGFRLQDDGLGEYPLDEGQTRKVAKLLGFHPEPERFFYYVEPCEAPQDSGLQPESSDLG
jgi:hypothetical protein